MPSVFLSHSRANLQRIEQIENGLKEANVSVWRDQEQLYGGEKWPKRLGEAIAAQEFFLLAWSENAQKSFFVELEWCTALALKKDIIICLLDDTPIPESLRSYHSITAKDAVHGVPGILKAVRKPMREKEPDRTNQVIDQLDQIPAEPPEEVLKSAKAIFQQHHWTVQGPVYQAGGDIIFPAPRGKWQAWAVIVGIPVAVLATIQIIDRFSSVSDHEEEIVVETLGGFIQDEDSNEYLSDVEVTITSPEFTEKAMTNEQGYFVFHPRAHKNMKVTLRARKKDYPDHVEDVELGDSRMRFAMKRMSK